VADLLRNAHIGHPVTTLVLDRSILLLVQYRPQRCPSFHRARGKLAKGLIGPVSLLTAGRAPMLAHIGQLPPRMPPASLAYSPPRALGGGSPEHRGFRCGGRFQCG